MATLESFATVKTKKSFILAFYRATDHKLASSSSFNWLSTPRTVFSWTLNH